MSYLAMAKAALSRLRASGSPSPEELSRLLAMPLDLFARAGASLEVRVPWLDVTLWQALVMDLALAAYFLVYTFVFNWGFDRVFGLPASALGGKAQAA